jgi:SAM-dependent methyltransferase
MACPMTSDHKRIAPATARNRDPILDVLRRELPSSGTVLEVASGSGEHVVHFAAALPALIFRPSDPEPSARASIDAWIAESGVINVLPAFPLDAAAPYWPIAAADAVICINMVHIAPWAATLGLLAGAARLLPPGGLLYLYGPYKRGGRHTAPSNAEFDENLRARDPQWGIRGVEAVSEAAAVCGFAAPEIIEMPANNLSLILRRPV